MGRIVGAVVMAELGRAGSMVDLAGFRCFLQWWRGLSWECPMSEFHVRVRQLGHAKRTELDGGGWLKSDAVSDFNCWSAVRRAHRYAPHLMQMRSESGAGN